MAMDVTMFLLALAMVFAQASILMLLRR